jgi:hypothetical protein
MLKEASTIISTIAYVSLDAQANNLLEHFDHLQKQQQVALLRDNFRELFKSYDGCFGQQTDVSSSKPLDCSGHINEFFELTYSIHCYMVYLCVILLSIPVVCCIISCFLAKISALGVFQKAKKS